MHAGDFEHAFGRQVFGQDHVMHRRARLPIRLSLKLYASDGGEMGERRSVGRTRDYAGAAPFLPVVTAVTFLIELELAIALGGRECGRDASKQRRMIALEFEGIMRPRRAHRGGHARMAMQGIAGYDATLENQALEYRQRAGN